MIMDNDKLIETVENNNLGDKITYNPDDLKEYLNTPQVMVDIEPDDIDND